MTDATQTLAVAWADAVRGTSFVSLEREELVTLLRGLAGRLLAAALADEPDEAAAADVGRALVDAHFTTPASLQHTMASLGDRLCAQVDAITGGHTYDGRVGAVMGALAAGYSAGLQELTRIEQEHITSAAFTALREAEAAKWHTEARYGAVFAAAHIGIAIAAVDGRILEVNRTLCELFGLTPREFRSRPFSSFTHPTDDPAMWERVGTMVAGEVDRLRMDKAYFRADGTEIWTDLVVSLARDADGRPAYMVAMVEDVTDRRELERRLRHQAGHDPLTGLANRATFYARLGEELDAGATVGVCCLDLDGFKRVNDTLGHSAGDELLRVIANRLQEGIGHLGLVARIGGDEFVVLVTGGTTQATEDVARRALELVRDPIVVDGHPVTVSASAGVASGVGESAAELLKAADTTLLWAKNDGRSRHAVYDRERHRAERARRDLAAEIPAALAAHAIEPHYQPLIGLADGRPHGVEALVRWRRPDGTLLPPDAFVPLAEETGVGRALGLHVLRSACAWAAGLGVPQPFVVSVNVSAQQVHDPALESDVLDVLAETGWPATALQLELTESDLMETAGRPLKTLTALAERGVSIAIDDFGTGYSNLAYLNDLPVTVVKLAGPFVAAPINTRLLDAVITMAHALGLVVTAEALETADQVAVLRDLGCDIGQGFHLGGVSPPAVLAEVLRSGRR